jgi:flagellar hook-associated protein 2
MTGVTGADDTTMSVSLATDTSAIETAVNSFVSTYNSMLAQINGDIAQQRNTAYPPLTSTQQSQMTDTDVADWNAAAQQGMLFQDPTLSALSREMQSDVTTPVSGITSSQYNSLASIGITSTDWKNGGLLTVDSTKLEQALATDPTSVYQILGKQGATSATQGVAYRLDTTMTKAMANIAYLAGTPSTTSYDTTSSLAIQISQYTTRITKEDAYLTGVQQRYQSQFSQMESVIQQMNSQSSFLSSSSSSSSSSG